MIVKPGRFIILFAVALALGLCLAMIHAKSEPSQAPAAPQLDTAKMWRGCEEQKDAIADFLRQTQAALAGKTAVIEAQNRQIEAQSAEIFELKKAKASN